MSEMDVEKAIELSIKDHDCALKYFQIGDVGIIAWIAGDAKDLLKKSEINVDIDFLKILVKQELDRLTKIEALVAVVN